MCSSGSQGVNLIRDDENLSSLSAKHAMRTELTQRLLGNATKRAEKTRVKGTNLVPSFSHPDGWENERHWEGGWKGTHFP